MLPRKAVALFVGFAIANCHASADEPAIENDGPTTDDAAVPQPTTDNGSTCDNENGFISSGGVVVDAGGVEVHAGGLQVHAGGVQVASGGLEVKDGGAVYESTAGFALQVVGKAAVTTTAENVPAFTIGTASNHFEDVLLQLQTATRASVSHSFTSRCG